MRYNLEKKKTGHPLNQCGQNDHKAEITAEKLAKEYDVSEKTIRRDAKFAEALDKLSPEERGTIGYPKYFKNTLIFCLTTFPYRYNL